MFVISSTIELSSDSHPHLSTARGGVTGKSQDGGDFLWYPHFR
jgi:hypothetical protein